MQDYFKALKRPKTPKQIADEEYRQAQIDRVRDEGLYEELAQLRAKNGNSPTLDMVQRVLDQVTKPHGK